MNYLKTLLLYYNKQLWILWSIANKILNRANCKFILIGSINLAPKLFKLIFKESKLFIPVGKRRGKMNFYTYYRKQKISADISFNLSPGNHPIRLAFQVNASNSFLLFASHSRIKLSLSPSLQHKNSAYRCFHTHSLTFNSF